jgi:hypothetical protein
MKQVLLILFVVSFSLNAWTDELNADIEMLFSSVETLKKGILNW